MTLPEPPVRDTAGYRRRRRLVLLLCAVVLAPVAASSAGTGLRELRAVDGRAVPDPAYPFVRGSLARDATFLAGAGNRAAAAFPGEALRLLYAGDVAARRVVLFLVDRGERVSLHLMDGPRGSLPGQLLLADAGEITSAPDEVVAYPLPGTGDGLRHFLIMPVGAGCGLRRADFPRIAADGTVSVTFHDQPLRDGAAVLAAPPGQNVSVWRTVCGHRTRTAEPLPALSPERFTAAYDRLSDLARAATGPGSGRADPTSVVEALSAGFAALGPAVLDGSARVVWGEGGSVALAVSRPGAGTLFVALERRAADRPPDQALVPLPAGDPGSRVIAWHGASAAQVGVLLPPGTARAEAVLESGNLGHVPVSPGIIHVSFPGELAVLRVNAYDAAGVRIGTAAPAPPWSAVYRT